MAGLEVSKDEVEGDNKEERAARVALCDAFPKSVLNSVRQVEGAFRVSREVDSRRLMEKEAKPRSE